ncbi:MAG TPA: Ig-like domain-containing protein, partial [Vicinamibacterales bacterium]|nr:Ig-like domain-containing protein [Vicinamibacterales bacterium]
QTGGLRRATNIAALKQFPGFYHGRQILIVGNVAVDKDRLDVSDDAGSIHLIAKGSAPDGLDEVRGEFWDIGRMKPDDPRLNGYDLRTVFHMDPDAPWPRPGEVTAIIASAVTPASTPTAPSIRAIVLNPDRYVGQKVTVSGQFSGRNLQGDLPEAPAKSRYDFVLRSSDAAVWISNMRPKLRDNNNKEYELGLDARIDTGRWLEVSGKVQLSRGLLWIDAEAGSLKAAKAPSEPVVTEEPVRVPAGPPPEVVFSAPTEDETDVATTTTVRIQLSRDVDQATLKNHIEVQYVTAQSLERGEPDTPKIDFTMQFNAAGRVIELKFAKPLERFRTVKVNILDGVKGTDGQALKPWTVSFTTGS